MNSDSPWDPSQNQFPCKVYAVETVNFFHPRLKPSLVSETWFEDSVSHLHDRVLNKRADSAVNLGQWQWENDKIEKAWAIDQLLTNLINQKY